MKRPPITERDYYFLSPSLQNQTGDVWLGLPSLGLLPQKVVSGVVVTPSCDLANGKTSTITYLPIIGVPDYIGSAAMMHELMACLDELANGIGVEPIRQLVEKRSRHLIDDLDTYRQIVENQDAHPVARNLEEFQDRKKRLLQGIYIASLIAKGERNIDLENISDVFGEKRLGKIREKIIRNSLSADIHFFPSDKQDKEWSAIPRHSVALFRYPISVPIEIFEYADNLGISDWVRAMETLSCRAKIASLFAEFRPVRCLRLKQDFLPDLLTRYTGLYMRIGSPDFTHETVQKFVGEIV